MAANLANIGKLAVPREILSKTEPLNAEEQEILRKVRQSDEAELVAMLRTALERCRTC
jgi:response regulator RpfG family c-di-GMP phosphodiesterase